MLGNVSVGSESHFRFVILGQKEALEEETLSPLISGVFPIFAKA